ncbi:CBS domain-containing protein [Marinobacter fonticola]|uniref:CBS domain-containing protein n=1 Tax=Marinobacter fonticola TaxID=2603215 RepID=UPI0011E73F19|nr:CBS domain-containing protein [Marinobacter fonticola]
MPIFVSEPGRPQQTRLPEALRGRQIGVVDEMNQGQAAHESRNDADDPSGEYQNQAAARRAIDEYGEQAQVDPNDVAAYLPLSRMASPAVYTLPTLATFDEALKEMARHTIHHMVITADDSVAGLVDQRWLLAWLHQHGDDARLVRFSTVELPSFLTATPETDAHQLARLMLAHQLSAALVIGTQGQPNGIVTKTDFLRLYAESSAQEGDV